MPFSEEQIAKLEADLDGACVQSRSQGGKTLSYIEGWKAIETANKIFGFGGWSRETVELNCVHTATDAGRNADKCEACYVCKVRVVVTVGEKDGLPIAIAREGTGYGNGIAKTMGDAHEGAAKEAETDAMKRALMTFGYQFGLALYDKAQEHVTRPEGVTDAGTEEAGDPAGYDSDSEW